MRADEQLNSKTDEENSFCIFYSIQNNTDSDPTSKAIKINGYTRSSKLSMNSVVRHSGCLISFFCVRECDFDLQ